MVIIMRTKIFPISTSNMALNRSKLSQNEQNHKFYTGIVRFFVCLFFKPTQKAVFQSICTSIRQSVGQLVGQCIPNTFQGFRTCPVATNLRLLKIAMQWGNLYIFAFYLQKWPLTHTDFHKIWCVDSSDKGVVKGTTPRALRQFKIWTAPKKLQKTAIFGHFWGSPPTSWKSRVIKFDMVNVWVTIVLQ